MPHGRPPPWARPVYAAAAVRKALCPGACVGMARLPDGRAGAAPPAGRSAEHASGPAWALPRALRPKAHHRAGRKTSVLTY